jgi:hypothetical protein
MHVQLPKPLHGWREFAGEVGIIVIGVLIALAAQQVVEAAHQRQQAEQADDIIRGELEFNLGRLQSRMQIRSCMVRRIEQMQALIDAAATQPDIVTPGWIGRPQYWTFHSSRWEAESQAGRAALVARDRLSEYGIMYGLMRDAESEMAAEQSDWAKLRMLEHLRRLDAPTLLELNSALQDARYRAWRVELVTTELFTSARALKLRATPNSNAASNSVCLPMTTTREAANRVSAWPIGEP